MFWIYNEMLNYIVGIINYKVVCVEIVMIIKIIYWVWRKFDEIIG